MPLGAGEQAASSCLRLNPACNSSQILLAHLLPRCYTSHRTRLTWFQTMLLACVGSARGASASGSALLKRTRCRAERQKRRRSLVAERPWPVCNQPRQQPMITMQPSQFLCCAALSLATLAQAQGGQFNSGLEANRSHHSITNIHELRWRWNYDQRAYPLGHI